MSTTMQNGKKNLRVQVTGSGGHGIVGLVMLQSMAIKPILQRYIQLIGMMTMHT